MGGGYFGGVYFGQYAPVVDDGVTQTISPTPVAISIVISAPVITNTAEFQSFAGIQRQLNPDDFGGTTFYLEVHGKTSSGASPMTAQLYNVTDSVYISGSSVSTSSTSKVRIRGTGFSLVAGNKIYEVRYGGNPGATYTLYDAVLLVEVG